jgi:hypothetical protein
MNADNTPGDAQERQPEQIANDNDTQVAWEQIEAGRYMPRRIRGSFRGGKLG